MSHVRVLWALLICVALPWQGVAAATRLHCAMMGGSAVTAHATQHTQSLHGVHGHHGVDAHVHSHDSEGAPFDAPTRDGNADCSALCCAAMISTTFSQLLLPLPTFALLPEIEAAGPTYEPDGFDRPPRT